MKGLVFKLMIILSLVLGAIHYSTDLATGKSLFNNWGFSLPAMPAFGSISIPDVNLPNINRPLVIDSTRKNNVPVKVYEWIDENGTIHYAQKNRMQPLRLP